MAWNVDLPSTLYVAPDLPNHVDPRSFIRLGSEDFQNLVNAVEAHQFVAIDTETTGLVRWKDVPLYWSIAFGQTRVTLHGSALAYFQNAFRDRRKRWIFANAKYDAHILANVGINLAGEFYDTQVMHGLLYEDKSHKLKDMAEHLFNWKWGSFEDLFGKIGKNRSSEERIREAEATNMPMLIEYAANDAWGTLTIYERLKDELERAHTHSLFWNVHPYINTLWDLFSKVEGRFTKVLWKMERRGALIDTERLDTIKPKAEAEILRLTQEISRHVGHVFNPNSDDQIREYFFEKCGIKPVKLTKGGKTGVRKPSVDKDVMEALAIDNEVAKMMVEHSAQSTLLSTFIRGLRDHCDYGGRIHTQFNQTPRTGRLSSSDPNLQNIPRPKNDRWNLRSAFISSKGKKLVVCDYSQLEMRLLAAASLEQDMIGIFERNEDVHIGNAAMIFGMPYDDIVQAKEVDKEVKDGKRPDSDMTSYVLQCLMARDASKTIGFGLVYGMGPKKLANDLKITLQEAKEKISIFMAKYTAVAKFLKDCVEETLKTGYAFTVMGRRRSIPQLQSYRHDERSQGERLAINTPIQGSAADIVRMAQINIDDMGLDRLYGYEMFLQVHDEVVGECPEETLEPVKRELRDALEHPFVMDLAVHTKIEMGVGGNWSVAK